MAECFYCEKDNEKRKALMLDVCELPYSIVYLFRDQKNKGRCVVAFKGHKTEYFQLTPEEKEAALHRKAARLLRIPEEDVLSVQVLRRSIDAREELHLVYTVAAEVRQEKQVLRRCRDRRVSRYAPERYALPEILSPPEVPPVVVGAGPGGLFAALVLARCGLRPAG